MTTNDLLITSAMFVINPVLFTGFIIPQVQRQKQLKDAMTKYDLGSSQRPDSREYTDELSEKSSTFQKKLGVYEIRHKELSRSVLLLIVSIVLSVCAILFANIFTEYTSSVIVLHATAQLVLLIMGILINAVLPGQLNTVPYLAGQMDVNLFNLIDAMRLTVIADTDRVVSEEEAIGIPLKISISIGLRCYGYRYVITIIGKSGKLYYLSYGPVEYSSTDIFRTIMPGGWWGEEYSRIVTGEIALNGIRGEEAMDVELFIFAGQRNNRDSHPYYARGRFGSRDAPLLSTDFGMNCIRGINTNNALIYQGIGSRVSSIRLGETPGPAELAIWKYRNPICNSQRNVSHVFIEGRTLE